MHSLKLKSVFTAAVAVLILMGPDQIALDASTNSRSPESMHTECRGDAHGWIKLSTANLNGYLRCFSPAINGGYAWIGAGRVNGHDDVSVQVNLLSRRQTQHCDTGMVSIDYVEGRIRWSAFRIGNSAFGQCTITQSFEAGHTIWRGQVTANLVRVKGNVKAGSPTRLHSEKDERGEPITKSIKLEWKFDEFAVQLK